LALSPPPPRSGSESMGALYCFSCGGGIKLKIYASGRFPEWNARAQLPRSRCGCCSICALQKKLDESTFLTLPPRLWNSKPSIWMQWTAKPTSDTRRAKFLRFTDDKTVYSFPSSAWNTDGKNFQLGSAVAFYSTNQTTTFKVNNSVYKVDSKFCEHTFFIPDEALSTVFTSRISAMGKENFENWIIWHQIWEFCSTWPLFVIKELKFRSKSSNVLCKNNIFHSCYKFILVKSLKLEIYCLRFKISSILGI